MGRLFKMSTGFSAVGPSSSGVPDNPRPTNFRIEDSLGYGKACILRVNYPDCTTYEGSKVLVFLGPLETVLQKIEQQGHLDPHFLEDDESMIARFRPTEEGMGLAKAFCEVLEVAYG